MKAYIRLHDLIVVDLRATTNYKDMQILACIFHRLRFIYMLQSYIIADGYSIVGHAQ